MTGEQAKKIAGHCVLGATFLLMAILVLINLSRAAFNPVILLAQLIPLGMTLPGQFRGSSRTMQWLCFIDMFFLVQGILLAFTPGNLWSGLAETGICLILFFSAIIFIRASRIAA